MNKLLSVIIIVSAVLLACKKNDFPATTQLSSVSFANATIGVATIIPQFNKPSIVYSTVTTAYKVNYGASNVYSVTPGTVSANFVQLTDTTRTLFSTNLVFQDRNIYSFYLTGTAAKPDTVFIHEQLPYYSTTDSVAGIRFINLSPGSNPISVNIKGQAIGSEAASLPFKAHTLFKTYKADHTVSNYVFEFRDASLGTLLATYTLSGVNNATVVSPTTSNIVRFKNQTIALIGQPTGGTVIQSAIRIPNY